MIDAYLTKGEHVICDFYEIPNAMDILEDIEYMKILIMLAIKESCAEIKQFHYHKFEPQGLTITAILSESSLDAHFYPESGFCSISIYTCGTVAKPILGIEYLKRELKPKHSNIVRIIRGEKENLKIETINS